MKKSKAITNLLVAAIVANNTTGINALENQTEDIINNEEVIELKEVTTEEIVEEKEETEEKKEEGNSTAGSSNTTGGSDNPPENTPPQSGDTIQPDTSVTPDMPETETAPTAQVDVNTEEALIRELKEGANIRLTGPITLNKKLQIRVNNVTIDGNNQIISQGDSTNDLFVISGTDVTISNLEINNYGKSGIQLYKSQNTKLENITLNGTSGSNTVGVLVNGAKATLKDIHTNNHSQAGIRLNNGSEVTFEGVNTHNGDTNQLQLDNSTPNILNNNEQYVEVSRKDNNVYYAIPVEVNSQQTLENAITNNDAIINITEGFTINKEIVITNNVSNITINGNNNVIDCQGTGRITVKSNGTKINSLTFNNYLNTTPLLIYKAKDVALSNITLEGNALSQNGTQVATADRSKIGLDIYNSTVTLDNLVSKNHLYKGIVVRTNSEVTINSTPLHFNDAVHMQVIKANGETITINDDTSEYKPDATTKDDKGRDVTNYFTKQEIKINSAKDLIANSKNSGTVLVLEQNITFDESLKSVLDAQDPHPFPDRANEEGFNRDLGLNIAQHLTIRGEGHTINLNGVCGITLKGDNIRVENAIITNSPSNGISVYNSKGAVLDRVTVKDNKKTGIVANGSIVELIDCKTINNRESGIMSTRSRTLDNPEKPTNYRDSEITIYGTFEQQEPNRCMIVRNLEMIKSPDVVQDNKIYFTEANQNILDTYRDIGKPEVKAKLNALNLEIFKDWLDSKQIPHDKEFGTTDTDYIKIQTTLDVTNQKECVENGQPILLDNTGFKDNTENFKKLLKYASLHGKELYFPAGTYKITGSIDLTKLGIQAFSNVTLSGAKDGLSIINGSESDRMLLIENTEYHAPMSYINVNNLAFDNVGLSFNGVYKNDITLNDNVFMNGKYTFENNKATMVPYITANNSTYKIERNIFLRGEKYAGRGISTYATKDSIIKDNYFGNLENKANGIKMIPALVNKLNLITQTRSVVGRQGNFFTCINNERRDTNVTIQNNYFDMNESRNIEGVPSDALISGIDVSKEGQRKDHIIYSKGYNGLNIVGNYFKGMENGVAGGLKIRNGKNAYIGSNHFKDVPLLTYIYGDLTPQECELINTTIYNNLFHETKNIGGQGTNILYYQSFRNGDDVKFPSGETVNGLQANVKNFVVYKNKFLSGDKSVVTISNRAEQIKDQFLFLDNKYEDKNELVNFNKGNLTIADTTVDVIEKALNGGYTTHNKVEIPLYPTKADKTQLPMEMDKANKFIESIKENVGDKEGQYSPVLVKQLKEAIKKAEEINNNANTTQLEINNAISEIHRLIDKINRDLNPDGSMDSGTTPNLPDDDLDGVIPETKPEIPDSDVVVSPEEDEEQPSIEDVVNEGGVGSAYEPVSLIVNTLKGLEQVLSSIVNSGSHISLFRLEDPTVDENKVVYKLHVIDGDSSYYIDIKVDSNADELTNLLNKIPNINDEENQPPVDGETKPETPVPPVDEDVKLPIDDENKENNNGNSSTINPGNGNSSNESTSNSGSNNNPQTGDVGVLGSIGLGLTSILGIFINNRKKKK